MAHGGLLPLMPLQRFPIEMHGMDLGYSKRLAFRRETRSWFPPANLKLLWQARESP